MGRAVLSVLSLPESEIERMAGNLPVTGGVELKLTWTLNGTPSALNVLHYLQNPITAMTQARADAISTAVKSAFTTSGWGAACWTGVALATVAVRDLGSNTNPWWIGAGVATPGTSAANPLPAATALVISLSTGLRGRSYNGRVYLWGASEDANDTGGGIAPVPGGAARSFIEAIASYMAGTQQSQPAVLSRFTTPPGATGAIERNPPILTQVTGVLLRDNRWDVQRRRANPGCVFCSWSRPITVAA